MTGFSTTPFELHQQYEKAFARYGRLMTLFVYQFTSDDVLLHLILNSALDKIIPVLQKPEPYMGYIGMILKLTREEALEVLKIDPTYDI